MIRMRILAQAKFRLIGVSFFGGFHEIFPGRKQHLISDRCNMQVEPGDVIEHIWEQDGVWFKDFEGEPPHHPLVKNHGEGRFSLDTITLREDYECPLKINGLGTIDELYSF